MIWPRSSICSENITRMEWWRNGAMEHWNDGLLGLQTGVEWLCCVDSAITPVIKAAFLSAQDDCSLKRRGLQIAPMTVAADERRLWLQIVIRKSHIVNATEPPQVGFYHFEEK